MSEQRSVSRQLNFARAELRGSGKSAVIDGLVLYAESGSCAATLLRRVVALMNGACESWAPSRLERHTLNVSSVGRRLDHPGLGVSLRVRGGTLEQGRALIADVARRWNEQAELQAESSGSASAAEVSEDALRLHRYHLVPSTAGVRLDHSELRLAVKVHAVDQRQAEAFAHRLALTWNMAEGWPSAAIDAGAVRALDEAVHQLVDAYERNENAATLIGLVAKRLRDRDSLADYTQGRAHDCARCLRREARDRATTEDEADGPESV